MDNLPSFPKKVPQTTVPSASLLGAPGGEGRAGPSPRDSQAQIRPCLCLSWLNSEPLGFQRGGTPSPDVGFQCCGFLVPPLTVPPEICRQLFRWPPSCALSFGSIPLLFSLSSVDSQGERR